MARKIEISIKATEEQICYEIQQYLRDRGFKMAYWTVEGDRLTNVISEKAYISLPTKLSSKLKHKKW